MYYKQIGLYNNQDHTYSNHSEKKQQSNDHQEVNSNIIFQEIEQELKQQQMMLNADDFSHRNWKLQGSQFEQKMKPSNYLPNEQIQQSAISAQSQNVGYTPSLRFLDETEGIKSYDKFPQNSNHYFQNQFSNGNSENSQPAVQDRIIPHFQMQITHTNNISSKDQYPEKNINKSQAFGHPSYQENKLNQTKQAESKLFSNFFIDSVSGNYTQSNEQFEEEQKKLYFQSVNNQQEALKDMLSQIEKKDSPQRRGQRENAAQMNQNESEYFNQQEMNNLGIQNVNSNSLNQFQSQGQLNSFLTNQSNLNQHSPSSPNQLAPKISFGLPLNHHNNIAQIDDQNDQKGQNFNCLNQKFFQHTQTVNNINIIIYQYNKLQLIQQLQEQIKEILSQKNKRQKIDSDEDIQTIDEQSRESSLDNTNRYSSINFTERPFNIISSDKGEEIKSSTGRLAATSSSSLYSKEPKINQKQKLSASIQNINKKREQRKDLQEKNQIQQQEKNQMLLQEKNQMQLQYERALDFKYNGIGNKKKPQNKQLTDIYTPSSNSNLQLDPMSPKHIFLKLSPKASQGHVKLNGTNITNILQTSNNTFQSTQTSHNNIINNNNINNNNNNNNNNQNLTQKDELSNFKRQINSLISKEQEIKSFFSGTNSITSTNVNNEGQQNENNSSNYSKMQIQSAVGELSEKSYNFESGSQQTLTDRISSKNRLSLQSRNKEQNGHNSKDGGDDDENIFDRLMRQNIAKEKKSTAEKNQPMKRSASAKQVFINTDINESSPRSTNYKQKQKISSTKNSTNKNQQLTYSQPKKSCIKQNVQSQLQIKAFNDNQHITQSEQDKIDQPLLVSDLYGQNSPPSRQRDLQQSNSAHTIIPPNYNNKLFTPTQVQFGKQPIVRSIGTMNTNGTPNSTNLSMYQNMNHTTSILSLRQQIESKILRSKDQISTPIQASFSAGTAYNNNSYDHNPLNNSHQNSKKIIAIHNQLINSDKPIQSEKVENNNGLVKSNEMTNSRGRFPLPLPPQKNQQNQQQQALRQSTDKRSSSLPKASYESLVQSALMRQQIFKNPDNSDNAQKNNDNSTSILNYPLSSQREKSPLNTAKFQNAESSSRTSRGVDSIGISSSSSTYIDRKKRTDSLQARNSSSSKNDDQNNKNKQIGMLRQSSERILKVNNNSNTISPLFYKPSQNSSGLHLLNSNHIINNHQQQRIDNHNIKIISNTYYDNTQPENEQKSLIEMDIIERNNAWLTQRKIKNEQRKLEQEKKEVEGCTFKPNLRTKSPHFNLEKEENYLLNQNSQYCLNNMQFDNSQTLQQSKQQQDLYSSYFNKSTISKNGSSSRLVTEGYSQQHQLNLLRKSSLNSVGSQKVKSIFPQNFIVNQYQ